MTDRRSQGDEERWAEAAALLPAALVDDLARAVSPDDLFETVNRWLPRIMVAERSTVALLAKDRPDSLDLIAIVDKQLVRDSRSVPIEGTTLGAAFRTHKQLYLPDLGDNPTPEIAPLVAAGYRSGLISPLVSGGVCYGSINIAKLALDGFEPHEFEQLSSVAALVASFLRVHAVARLAETSAITDELTKLLNRRGILQHLAEQVEAPEEATSVMYIDIDSFKSINDAFGHAVGDEVIREASSRIADTLPEDGRIGRLGGDEFLVVLPDDLAGTRALAQAESIRGRCNRSMEIGQLVLDPKVSVGVATMANGPEIDSLLMRDADTAMYVAKRAPGRIAVADDSIRRTAQIATTVDRELDSAMADGSLQHHFQPIRSLATGEIMGAEALLRWSHPEMGSIPAPTVVERVEATGRINEFTRWTLEKVAADWTQVKAELPWFADKAVSINLNPNQLAWPSYSKLHSETLDRHGLRPADIIVEVVESSEIQPDDPAQGTLQQLARQGVVIALDDFGTGHNALRYFTMFPIHAIKLDRSLVGLLETSEVSRTILAALATLAHDLNILPVVEGIENAAEAQWCLERGVIHGQGWHLGYPLPVGEFIEFARGVHHGEPSAIAPSRRSSDAAPLRTTEPAQRPVTDERSSDHVVG